MSSKRFLVFSVTVIAILSQSFDAQSQIPGPIVIPTRTPTAIATSTLIETGPTFYSTPLPTAWPAPTVYPTSLPTAWPSPTAWSTPTFYSTPLPTARPTPCENLSTENDVSKIILCLGDDTLAVRVAATDRLTIIINTAYDVTDDPAAFISSEPIATLLAYFSTFPYDETADPEILDGVQNAIAASHATDGFSGYAVNENSPAALISETALADSLSSTLTDSELNLLGEEYFVVAPLPRIPPCQVTLYSLKKPHSCLPCKKIELALKKAGVVFQLEQYDPPVNWPKAVKEMPTMRVICGAKVRFVKGVELEKLIPKYKQLIDGTFLD